MPLAGRMAIWLVALSVLSAGQLFAGTIGGSCASNIGGSTSGDSGECGGVIYTVTYSLEDGHLADGNMLYDFTLQVNTSGLNTTAGTRRHVRRRPSALGKDPGSRPESGA